MATQIRASIAAQLKEVPYTRPLLRLLGPASFSYLGLGVPAVAAGFAVAKGAGLVVTSYGQRVSQGRRKPALGAGFGFRSGGGGI